MIGISWYCNWNQWGFESLGFWVIKIVNIMSWED